jgi:hypothetical protein
MTDLFDRVAAQALGLNLALRPRTRSRFEPESLGPEIDDVAVGFAEQGQPAIPPPAPGEMSDEPHFFGAETAAQQHVQIQPVQSDVEFAELKSSAAPSNQSENRPPRPLAPLYQTQEDDQKSHPPLRGQTASYEISPELVAPEDMSSLEAWRAAPERGGDRISPTALPDEKRKVPISEPANAGSNYHRPPAIHASPTPIVTSSVEINNASTSPPPSPQSLPRKPTRQVELDGAADPPAPEHRRQPDFGPPQRSHVEREQIARPVVAPSPPDIAITIGRLEIRAEPQAASRPAKPFQPHLDLAAYRARRKGAP